MAYVAPSTRANGDIITATIWNQDVVENAIALKASKVEFLYTHNSTVTVANSLAETTLLSGAPTLAANFLTVGKTLRVRLQGHYSTSGTPTITIRVKIGSVTIATFSTSTESGAAQAQLYIESLFTCRSTGVSGTVMPQNFRQIGTASPIGMQSGIVSTVTVNTTASGTLDVTAQWGTASASNTVSSLVGSIEAFN